MNVRKVYVYLLWVFFLPSCLLNSADTSEESKDLAVQVISNSPLVTSYIKQITPLINNIVKEELGLRQDCDFEFFIPKKLQRITVYYLYGIDQIGESKALAVLDAMHVTTLFPKTVSITANVEFFGDQQDELVIKIDDSGTELLSLNTLIKDKMHAENDVYKMKHHKDMYEIAKSERYSFIPHMGLGRVRLQRIKDHIKDVSSIESVLEKIKVKIKQEAHKILEEALAGSKQMLLFNKFGALDLKKQMYIKEWVSQG